MEADGSIIINTKIDASEFNTKTNEMGKKFGTKITGMTAKVT